MGPGKRFLAGGSVAIGVPELQSVFEDAAADELSIETSSGEVERVVGQMPGKRRSSRC
jgi:hypothetical protein